MSLLIEAILPCRITSNRFIPWAMLLGTLLLAACGGNQATGTDELEAATSVPSSITALTEEPFTTTEERGAVDKVVVVRPGMTDYVNSGPYCIGVSSQDFQDSSSFTLNASVQ